MNTIFSLMQSHSVCFLGTSLIGILVFSLLIVRNIKLNLAYTGGMVAHVWYTLGIVFFSAVLFLTVMFDMVMYAMTHHP